MLTGGAAPKPLHFQTWPGTGCAQPCPWTFGEQRDCSPRAGGPVGRTHRKEGRFLGCLLTILVSCQCLAPVTSLTLYVLVRREVPISFSPGFPEESNKNSQRLHTEQGREAVKGFYLLLRRTDNPTYTPSAHQGRLNNFSFKVTFSLGESGNGFSFWFH